MSKFWESGQITFSLIVSKNYFSQVYGQKFGQKCHYLRKFGQNMSFLVKLIKFGTFWDQNDVIGPPFREGRKYFFLKTVSKVI